MDREEVVRALLAQVLDALDVPHPATRGDRPAYEELMEIRVMQVRGTLKVVRDYNWSTDTAALATRNLAQWVADSPPDGYEHYKPVEERAEEQGS